MNMKIVLVVYVFLVVMFWNLDRFTRTHTQASESLGWSTRQRGRRQL